VANQTYEAVRIPPDRIASKKRCWNGGRFYVAVDHYELTNAPHVFTAVLICGHTRRFDEDRRGRHSMLQCRECESERRSEA
jgi:hypothetical protein